MKSPWALACALFLAVATPAQANGWRPNFLPGASPSPQATVTQAPPSPDAAASAVQLDAPASGLASPSSPSPSARPVPPGMAYVWQVTAPGASEPDWVVGTMHVPLPAGAGFPPPLATALKQATWVATEIDPEGVSPELVRRYVAQPPGGRLSRQLGPRRWRALLATGKVDAAAAEALRPWAVALAFLPAPRRPSMDESLRSAGAAAGARLGSLESPAEQLGALAAVPDVEMIRQLDELAADPTRGNREQNTLEAAYRKGDLPTIRRMLLDPARMRRYPGFYRKLFTERNARMAERLMAPLAKEKAVVAVGLGHLLGQGNVLERLARKGWKVRQVWPALAQAPNTARPAVARPGQARPGQAPRPKPQQRPRLRPSATRGQHALPLRPPARPVARPATAPTVQSDLARPAAVRPTGARPRP